MMLDNQIQKQAVHNYLAVKMDTNGILIMMLVFYILLVQVSQVH